MFFCNMLGDEYIKSYNNGKVVIDRGDVSKCFFYQDSDGVLKLTEDTSKENLFYKGLNGDKDSVYRVGKPNGRKGNITYAMIEDTDENPLIVVLCKNITLFEGIEAELRYITLNDNCILACLVSGICSFDGITMSRCNTMNYSNKNMFIYDSEKLRELSNEIYIEPLSKYNYSNDVISTLLILHEADNGFSVKNTTGKDKLFISTEKLENAKQAYLEREARRKFLEEEQKAQIKARRDEILAKEEEMRKAEENKKKKQMEEEASVGAASFLEALKALQGK